MGEDLISYDLAAPDKRLVPRMTPLRLRDLDSRPRPRYVPTPLPEGMTRVMLTPGDFDEPPGFSDFGTADPVAVDPHSVFDIPAEQHERWQAAEDAISAMYAEIEALIRAREGHG